MMRASWYNLPDSAQNTLWQCISAQFPHMNGLQVSTTLYGLVHLETSVEEFSERSQGVMLKSVAKSVATMNDVEAATTFIA